MDAHRALSWLLALLACIAWTNLAQSMERRLIVAGPDWRPSAELQACWRRNAAPSGCSLSFGDSTALELSGGQLKPCSLAETPNNPWSEAREREVAQLVAQAELIELHGGTWLGWWQRCLPDKKPSRLLQALRAAQERGVLIIARGEAARFAAGGIVRPEDVGRLMRGPQAQERPWCVAGYLAEVPVLLEYEDADSRGVGRVLYAAARELRLHGGREVERAWVVQRAGAIALDLSSERALVLDLPVLRIGLEAMRKVSSLEMKDVALTVLEAPAFRDTVWRGERAETVPDAAPDSWQAWLTQPRALGLAGTLTQPAPPAQDMRVQTLLRALREPTASVHSDRYGSVDRGAGANVVRWRALEQPSSPSPR